jgi:sugar phosphate isomerase/epimerase
MKPIAIQLYTLREKAKTDFVGVLKLLADIGYVGVEPAGLHGMKAREVRKVLDDLGLKCCSIHGPFPTKENAAKTVDEAAELGTDMIISGLGPKDFASAAVRAESVKRLAEAAHLISDAGGQFGYHNHWWEFDKVDGQLGYDVLLKEIDDMFSELDIYWACNFGAVNVPKVIAAHRGRIALLHVKDGPLVRDQPHTAVGKGKMHIKLNIEAVDPDVCKWMVVELDNCGTDMVQAVKDSYKYLTGEGLAQGNK